MCNLQDFMASNGISGARTVAETIGFLPSPAITQLPKPNYEGKPIDSRRRLALAVESMRHHMTDEGWQIMEGLYRSGYLLCGYNLPYKSTDVALLIKELNPSTVILQDKREWDVQPGDFREPNAMFRNVHCLKENHSTFKLTLLKDSHQKPLYHRESADEIGCHAWVTYYHSDIVSHLAPYTRKEHLLRTYHTINSLLVPSYQYQERKGTILSGAISSVYPLRSRLVAACRRGELPCISSFRHPGYHRNGTNTPEFLKLLSKFKVSICTASIFGYALRKIIESTACGCIVITDLPTDERLPYIDTNLVRIHPDTTPEQIAKLAKHLCETYNPDLQEAYSSIARKFYDYRHVTQRLSTDIENLRSNYHQS